MKNSKPEFIATLISLSRTTPFNRTNFSTNVKFNNYFLVAYICGKKMLQNDVFQVIFAFNIPLSAES